MESFSVSELARYQKFREKGAEEAIKSQVTSNLMSPADENLQPDFSDTEEDLAISTAIHDSVVELYRQQPEDDVEQFLEENLLSPSGSLSGTIKALEEDTELDRRDVLESNVYGMAVEDALKSIADFYNEARENEATINVETEKKLENNGFWGRADIIREFAMEGQTVTELRDIKTHYSNASLPRKIDEYKIASYALTSYADQEIDRIVLEYPVQGFEIEVDPHDWIGFIAEDAAEYEDLLEYAREQQAEKLELDLPVNREDKDNREFVHGLNLPNDMNYAYASSAASEAVPRVL